MFGMSGYLLAALLVGIAGTVGMRFFRSRVARMLIGIPCMVGMVVLVLMWAI